MSTNATDKGLLTLEPAQRTASLGRLRARPDFGSYGVPGRSVASRDYCV